MLKCRDILRSGLRLSLIGSFLILVACSNFNPREEGALEGLSAQDIFLRGEQELEGGNAKEAAFYFSEIERLFPYSELTPRALIMQGYAYQNAEDYDNARSTLNRYIEFYPAEDDAAYAHYLLALTYYDQIDEIGRDQGLTFKALQALRDVIEKFPDTEYARSSVLKFDLAFNHLAAKEMEVGRYYLKRGYYSAAVNRFRVVVQDFQTTTLTAEALYRLVESYLALGLIHDAKQAAAILGHNYQSSVWYQEAYTLLREQGLDAPSNDTQQKAGQHWLTGVYKTTEQTQTKEE